MRAVLLLTLSAWISVSTVPLKAQSERRGTSDIPDHVIYGELFRRVSNYAHRANAAERTARPRPNLRELVRTDVGLDATQGSYLEQIALECERDIKEYDRKARILIEQFRNRNPYQIRDKKRGVERPPSELQTLWSQRTAAILLARERLRSALGEASYAKLDTHLREQAAKRMEAIRPLDVGQVPGHRRLPSH